MMARIAVLVAGIGVAIALIGPSGGSSSAQAAVRHALARTVDAGSSRFTLSYEIPQGEAPFSPDDYKVDGVMDYVRHRGLITFGSYSNVLIEGDMMYIRTALPWRHGEVWISSDTSTQQSDPFDLQERAMNNPLSLLKFLTGVGSDVRNAGTEQVRAADTIHYEGTLNLQNVVENAPPDDRANLKDTLDFIGQFEPTSVPFGLWVDADGGARRLRIDQKGGGSTVIEYYDFGLPVSVNPPPANETITFEQLFKEYEDHQTDSNCEGDQSSWDGSSYNDQMSLPETHVTYSVGAPALEPTTRKIYWVCSTIGGG